MRCKLACRRILFVSGLCGENRTSGEREAIAQCCPMEMKRSGIELCPDGNGRKRECGSSFICVSLFTIPDEKYFCFFVLCGKMGVGGDIVTVWKMSEVNVMEATIDNRIKDALQGDENLMRMLDRGIDDMEAGRELLLDEAFRKITELRDKRRNART